MKTNSKLELFIQHFNKDHTEFHLFIATMDGSEVKPLIDKPPKSESQTNYRDTSKIRRKALEPIL